MNMLVGYQLELIFYEGVEFFYVLFGQIVYIIEGCQYFFGVGDLVYFDVIKIYCLVNVGSDVVEVLIIIIMGLFDDYLMF